MSILDKVVAAITPPESESARSEARARAQAVASPGDWLSLVLEQHRSIEAAFAAVKSAGDAAARRSAQAQLHDVLAAHSIAEEEVLYPALALADEAGHAGMGYTEQAATKLQMALLDTLDPMSQDYIDKLEHIQGAVAHHVYQEEGTWYPELKERFPTVEAAALTERYRAAFERYSSKRRDLAA